MSDSNRSEFFALFESARAANREERQLALDRERLSLESQKIGLERERLEMERKRLAVSLYIEDFKARWQELLNFENENNRWTTLYVTALLLVIGWILNNGGKYNGIAGLYGQNDNAYFIMSIAIINALYTFAMSFKGYQIQQIAQYQYEHLARKIEEEVRVQFDEWERYRREAFAKNRGPEPIRRIYYILIGSLPTLVSYTILFLYLRFEWRGQAARNGWESGQNWFWIGAVLLVTLSLVFAISTSKLNSRWDTLLGGPGDEVAQDGSASDE